MAARTHRTVVPERPLRVYVDTSVFGGVHDDEFRKGSQRFFRAVRDGAFTILTSEPLTLEIARAPERIRDTFLEYQDFAEPLTTTDEAEDHAQAYMLAKVLPAASASTRYTSPSHPSHMPTSSSAGTSDTLSSSGVFALSMP